jgi:arylsulfatase A-like enzyme
MRKPNIVFIDAHDTGDWLGCYGRSVLNTPHIDSLANRGVVFDNAFATCPICGPSRLGFITGRYAHSMDVYGNSDYLPRPEPIPMARHFQRSGYRTWKHGGWMTNGTAQWAGYELVTSSAPEAIPGLFGDAVTDRSDGPPLFAHFSFFECHRPFGDSYSPDVAASIEIPPGVPDDTITRRDYASFVSVVERLDRCIGHVLSGIRASGIESDTVVVFLTDHGVAFPRAKHTLYDAGLRTALIIADPRLSLRAGTRVDKLVSNLDVFPTVLELAGIHVGSMYPHNGRSALPLMKGDAVTPRDKVFAMMTYGQRKGMQYYTPMRSVRTERFKLIRNYTEDPLFVDTNYLGRYAHHREALDSWPYFGAPRPETEFYDLRNDPWELTNLAEDPGSSTTISELSSALTSELQSTGDKILDGAVPSKKDSPVLNLWVKPEMADSYKIRFDYHLETSERPFPEE